MGDPGRLHVQERNSVVVEIEVQTAKPSLKLGGGAKRRLRSAAVFVRMAQRVGYRRHLNVAGSGNLGVEGSRVRIRAADQDVLVDSVKAQDLAELQLGVTANAAIDGRPPGRKKAKVNADAHRARFLALRLDRLHKDGTCRSYRNA
jgi:hypothetical protein